MTDTEADIAVGTDAVRFRRTGEVAVIELNRPRARNAVDADVARGIERCLDLVEDDGGLRAAVLCGVPPVFSAGADLKEIAAGRAAALVTDRGGFAGLVRRERTKPLVAAVDGPALAGGTELVLACDLVVASTRASFGLPEVKRGLVAAAGGLFRLGHKIPVNVAMECVLTGEPIDARRAFAFGLVNVLCPEGEAGAEGIALAARIAANAPLAVRESRRIVAEGTYRTDAEAWRLSSAAERLVAGSADVAEGVRAFIEKRPPRWTGR
jgi:enoyl-CoA hydratase/carnithine racemase